MAKVGAGAAYLNLTGPDNGASQGLQYWGGIKADENAAQKLADEREGVRKSEEIKAWEEKYGLKADDFQNKYTGFKTFDEVHPDFGRYASDLYAQKQREAKDALLKGDGEKRRQLEAELFKIKHSFGNVAKSEEFFAKKFEDYTKAMSEDKVSGSSKQYEDIVQEALLNKNYAIRYDDAGNLVYTVKNGEGTFTDIPYQDLMDGSFTYYKKQKLSGEDGIVSAISGDLGTKLVEGEDGMFKLSTQKWDDKLHGDAASKAIDAYISSDEVMGDLLYQFSKGEKQKMFNFTDEERSMVKDQLQTLVRASYSEKFGRDFDSSRDASARDWTKIKKEDEETFIEAEPVTTPTGELISGGQSPSSIGPPRQIPGGAFTLKTKGGAPIKGVITDLPDAEILTITKSNGEYYADIRVSYPVTQEDMMTGDKSKKTVTENTRTVKLTDRELNRLARGMGLPTAADLNTYLDQRSSSFQERSGQSKPSAKDLINKYKNK